MTIYFWRVFLKYLSGWHGGFIFFLKRIFKGFTLRKSFFICYSKTKELRKRQRMLYRTYVISQVFVIAKPNLIDTRLTGKVNLLRLLLRETSGTNSYENVKLRVVAKQR